MDEFDLELKYGKSSARLLLALMCLSGLSVAFAVAAIFAGHPFLALRVFSGAVLLILLCLLTRPFFDRGIDV